MPRQVRAARFSSQLALRRQEEVQEDPPGVGPWDMLMRRAEPRLRGGKGVKKDAGKEGYNTDLRARQQHCWER